MSKLNKINPDEGVIVINNSYMKWCNENGSIGDLYLYILINAMLAPDSIKVYNKYKHIEEIVKLNHGQIILYTEKPAEKYNVDPKTIRNWIKKLVDLNMISIDNIAGWNMITILDYDEATNHEFDQVKLETEST